MKSKSHHRLAEEFKKATEARRGTDKKARIDEVNLFDGASDQLNLGGSSGESKTVSYMGLT